MAILDFVCANPDRNEINCHITRSGDIIAIDNGACFDKHFESYSSLFTDEFRGRELDVKLLAELRAVDSNQLRLALEDAGLARDAVAGSLARLAEIQNTGLIPEKIQHERIEGDFDWL
ncbi:hypothetical protein [Nocardia brasiliensis]